MARSDDSRLARKASFHRGSLHLAAVKEEARLAATAQAVYGDLTPHFSGTTTASVPHEVTHFASDESSSHGGGSVHSTELAIRRGSQLGLEASNDSIVGDGDMFQSAHDFDLTTITEDATSHTNASHSHPPLHHKVKKKKIRWRFMKKRTSKKGSTITGKSLKLRKKKDGDTAAWLCGCCGKVYLSEATAEQHENECLNKVLERLGPRQDGSLLLRRPQSHGILKDSEADPLRLLESLPPEETTTPRPHAKSVDFEMPPTTLMDLPEDDAFPPFGSPIAAASSSDAKSMPLATTPLDSTFRRSNLGSRRERMMSAASSGSRFGLRSNRRRSHSDSEMILSPHHRPEDNVLLPHNLKQYLVLTDEAVVNVALKGEEQLLTWEQRNAELELSLLAADKKYYDKLNEYAAACRTSRVERYRAEGSGVLAKVQNKMVDAYQLIKEGDAEDTGRADHYLSKNKGADMDGELEHTDTTLYVNVVVKHSIQVVNNELERLARERWTQDMTPRRSVTEQNKDSQVERFERFRRIAHGNLVKLAGLALASDFTPRRVAVQLSNDLYRLIVPKLRKRGVTVETEIEYRVGPYFILALNVKRIDWSKLLKYTHRDVAKRREKWKVHREQRQEQLEEGVVKDDADDENEPEKESYFKYFIRSCRRLISFSELEIIALVLYWLHYLHWIISIPLCHIAYYFFFRKVMNRFVLTTVTDEVFSYVEKKGMEMEIRVMYARYQAAFMLSALRELREDSRELKKKKKETEGAKKGVVLGPLLGPDIKFDSKPAEPPPGFEPPENLEFVGLEVDLPVGFKRLRWAILSAQSEFVKSAVFAAEAKYENIIFEPWSHHDEYIGLPDLPPNINPEDFIGAERETNFLMPKSAFVKANTAYETNILTAYNDYCFCIKKRTLTPDVPYGGTFVSWTQLLITNSGDNTCRLVCSVEAEFPNGPPLVGRQIKSGMRAGTAELFVLIGETIEKYADEYP